MTSYVLDTNNGVFASTQQYSNSISPKASLSYAFEDPAKFGAFGTNARINASLTRDYASSVATMTTGQLASNIALINGTIQPNVGFAPRPGRARRPTRNGAPASTCRPTSSSGGTRRCHRARD